MLLPLLMCAVTPQQSKAPEQPTLYEVGYAHLDTQWRWVFPQTVNEFLKNTLHDNFALIEKYPNYIFNFTGSNRYRLMKEYFPADYQRMKGYIAAGRWFPGGSSVEEGDVNSPGVESLIRQVMYGNQYFRREFNKESCEYMLPDCFGFPAALPSILAHCGIKGFSTQKLTWGSAVGTPFNVGVWEGPDGKSVVAALNPGSYGTRLTKDMSQEADWLKRAIATGKKSGAFVDYAYYGTGDFGGAPDENSVQWLEKSVAGTGPLKVVSATSEQMFKNITPAQIAKLPRYKGDLLLTQHSAGSITSEAMIKRWNRENEQMAKAAEGTAAMSSWLGGPSYPYKKLLDAWTLMLGSHFHDTMAGTALPKSYDYAWNDDLIALNQFAAITTDSVGTISKTLNTSTRGVPVIVYNNLSGTRNDVAEVTVTFPGAAPEAVEVTSPSGQVVKSQVLSRTGNTAKVLFNAQVPSMGFAVYGVKAASANQPTKLRISNNSLENSRYVVKVNAAGDVSSVYDKLVKKELLKQPIRLAFQYEKPQEWPAWNMDWEDQNKPPRAYVDGTAKIRVAERGPVRVSLEITRQAQGSKFVQEVRLTDGPSGNRVEFYDHIDWKSKESALKAEFHLAASSPKATYNWQIGAIERPNNNKVKYEVPQHEWLDLTDRRGKFGTTILTGKKYASDKPNDNTLRLTLIYTPGVRGGYQDQAFQDWGHHDILYGLYGHNGSWNSSDAPRQANELDQPLMAFQTTAHRGGSKQLSLASTSNDNVEILALKRAEESNEYIVRLKEHAGKAANNVVITSFGKILSAREVDGQEKAIGRATVKNGALVTSLTPFNVRAFAITLAKPATKVATTSTQSVKLPFNADVVSTNENRIDGNLTKGLTIPAEQFGTGVVADGIPFKFGPTQDGAKNAVAANGQTIALPKGNWSKVYVLATSSNGDRQATFKVGKQQISRTIQYWTGFIGAWDHRLWKGVEPVFAYGWQNDIKGVEPAFIKDGNIAWYCSHNHSATKDEVYDYSYIYKYALPVPAGAKTLTLPKDANTKVFAVTVASNTHDVVTPATPMHDDFTRKAAAPVAYPSGGKFDDSIQVELTPSLFGRDEDIRYTLDGSEPTRYSQPYTVPIQLSSSTTIKARTFLPKGESSATYSASYEVNDTTAPRILKVQGWTQVNSVNVEFNEILDRATAEDTKNYNFKGYEVTKAQLSNNLKSVLLTLDKPIEGDKTEGTISGVADRSPNHNAAKTDVEFRTPNPVFTIDSLTCDGKTFTYEKLGRLPVKASDHWTINLLVNPDSQLVHLTPIAGFGYNSDSHQGGARYLAKFREGVHFWGCDVDVTGSQDIEPNKWQMITATYDGETIRTYKNGVQVGSEKTGLADAEDVVRIAPIDAWDKKRIFKGKIKDFAIWREAMPAQAVKTLWQRSSTK